MLALRTTTLLSLSLVIFGDNLEAIGQQSQDFDILCPKNTEGPARRPRAALFSRIQNVRWGLSGTGFVVNVDCSRDGGRTFEPTGGVGLVDTGVYTWNTAGPDSAEAVIRIQRYDRTHDSDVFVIDNHEELYTFSSTVGETDPTAPGSTYRSRQEIHDRLVELSAQGLIELQTISNVDGVEGDLEVALISDADDVRMGEGKLEPEPAVFINAGLHAREWIAPEAALRTIEDLVTLTDESIVRLRNDTKIYVLVVANPEGLAWSHKFWNKVVFYPTYAVSTSLHGVHNKLLVSIRDGRYRRKNRRDKQDELLYNATETTGGPTATSDALFGVDLNRNFSTDFLEVGCEGSDEYPGPSGSSERETRSIERFLTDTFPSTAELRASLDLHNNLQTVFAADVPGASAEYEQIVSDLSSELRQALNSRMRNYDIVIDEGKPGSYRRHVAKQFVIPSFVLELPTSVRKDRDKVSFFVADTYVSAESVDARNAAWKLIDWSTGPPIVERVQIGGGVQYDGRWIDSSPTSRNLQVAPTAPITPGQYRIRVQFNRPMRDIIYWKDRVATPPDPVVTWGDSYPFADHQVARGDGWVTTVWSFDTWDGVLTLTAGDLPPDLPPDGVHAFHISVAAIDPFGNSLDSMPGSMTRWSGRWVNYEDESGSGFSGGRDLSHMFWAKR